MGEFRRVASRVWWSSFPEREPEPVPEPELARGASSSPSSSHKSQDSGFSDSDHHHDAPAVFPNCIDLSFSPAKPVRKEESPQERANIVRPQSPASPFLNRINLSFSPVKIQKVSLDDEELPQECGNLDRPKLSSSSFLNSADLSFPSKKFHKDLPESKNVTRDQIDPPSPFLDRVDISFCPVKVQKGVEVIKDLSQKRINLSGSQSPPSPARARKESPTRFLDRSDLSFSPVKLAPCLDLSGAPGPPAHTSTPKKHGRSANLLGSFRSNSISTVGVWDGPVQRWLSDLMAAYEPECTATLQSKSLAADLGHRVAAMAAAATDSVRTLQERTRLISAEFAKLCRQLELRNNEHVGPLVQSLVGHISEFLRKHQPLEDEQPLLEACNRLRDATTLSPPNQQQLTDNVAALGHAFTHVVDHVLLQHIMVLVGVLEQPGDELALRSALSSLAALGLEGRHLSRLVAKCGGIRALLAILIECRSSSVRAAALRALATVCCVADSIRQLEQAGGVEILAELLIDETRPEPEASEAAAVLAQITAPWVEDNQGVQGLAEQLPVLVQALTRLSSNTKSSETLLLSAAALANLTFMEPRAVWPLLTCGAAGHLLQAVRRHGASASVFLQEQAATLLANMAAVPESRPQLAEQRAVVALLCFLQVRHSPLQEAPEIAAAERVQHKSAIALSRLCSDPEVASQVVDLQGVARLVRLCKDERERNHSDGVLVACLAALRKIAANCGTKVMEDMDAMELVEPRLLDSFLIYSSRQESYV